MASPSPIPASIAAALLLGAATTQATVGFTVGAVGTHTSIQAAVNACPASGCNIWLVDSVYQLPREIWIGGKNNLVIEPSPALTLAGTRPRLKFASNAGRFADSGTASNPGDPLRPAGWKTWPINDTDLPGGSRNTTNPYSTTGFQYNGLVVVDSSSNIRLNGLLLDGGTPQYFVNKGVWDGKWDVMFGSVGVNLHHSKDVVIRGCEIRGFFSAIYINNANRGGSVAPADSLDAGVPTSPGSAAGKMGGHLVERNLVHDNWWAVYDEMEWDVGSTFRFNVCTGNFNTRFTTSNDSTSEANNQAGGFLYLKDAPRAIHRIHNNTIWGSPMIMGHGGFKVGTQHMFYNNIMGGFDLLPAKLRAMVRDWRQLLATSNYWNANNVLALGVSDSNYMQQSIKSAQIADSAACFAAGGYPSPCWANLDTPVKVINDVSPAAYWSGWYARRGTPFLATYDGKAFLAPSTQNVEFFTGGGFFDSAIGIGVKKHALTEERWVKTIPWKSTTAGTAGYFEPVWDDSLVLNAIKGKGRRNAGWTNGSLDIGAIVTNAIDTPSTQGPRSSMWISHAGATCWHIPMQFDAKTVSARVTSLKAWSVSFSGSTQYLPTAEPTAIVARLSDSAIANGSSLEVCADVSPTASADLRFQIDSRATLADGRIVDFEPAVFLATANAPASTGTRSWIRASPLRLIRTGNDLVAKGLSAGEVDIELRSLDGRVLGAISTTPTNGMASIRLPQGTRRPMLLRVRQGDKSWQQVVLPL